MMILKRAFLALLVAAFIQSYAAFAQDDSGKAPAPIPVVIFDSTSSYGDSVPKYAVDTRDALRADSRFEALLFSPDSPTFTLAAKTSTPPLDLTQVDSPGDELSITQAVDAPYYVVLTPSDKDRKVTAVIVSIAFGNQQTITAPESPADIAPDIVNQIENWPLPTSTTPAPQVSALAQTESTPPATVAPPVAATAPAAPVAVPSPPVTVPQTAPAPIAPAQPPAPFPAASAPATAPTAPVAAQETQTPPSQTTTAQPVLSSGVPAEVVSPTLDINPAPVTPAPVEAAPTPTATPAPTAPVSPTPAIAAPVQTPTAPLVSITQVPVPAAPTPVVATPVQTPTAPVISITQVPASPPSATQSLSSSVTTDLGAAPTVTISGVTVGGQPIDNSTVVVQPPATAGALLGTTVSDASKALMDKGDAAVQASDNLSAIADYEQAISQSPRASAPRLKLANAYLEAGLKDQASDEARRALAIDPGDSDVANFIKDQDNGPAGPGGDVIIAQAQTESDPNNPAAWISLGDAYWNVSDPDDSLISYKHAADIDPNAVLPQTRLAKLYAAREQYDLSLQALQHSGAAGYPYALEIISSRSASVLGDIDDLTDQYTKGQCTLEQLSSQMTADNTEAENLADFVSKITPPTQYLVSHLHRELSTRLIAQTASVWVDFAETSNNDDKGEAADLEKHAISEMNTASIAEDIQAHINHQ